MATVGDYKDYVLTPEWGNKYGIYCTPSTTTGSVSYTTTSPADAWWTPIKGIASGETSPQYRTLVFRGEEIDTNKIAQLLAARIDGDYFYKKLTIRPKYTPEYKPDDWSVRFVGVDSAMDEFVIPEPEPYGRHVILSYGLLEELSDVIGLS